ncbi:MAG: phosphoglycerate kinase [Candidatus Ryanbacteria bacterium RIFCSPLOWO2_12_FULL_47_9c]|uniref:Phosphoglycerate kinase n=1 Tax=Candidatus Ryanbacteria bacterium RIFCSPLOWO2_12_FULL_47_9c TaxID=1802131 RepID=A0A1G2H362_9BACT|nr:MAG: phosphoglycerate kinase [Candidatus Ryanbacteria bacterium RIFCSPHIGHO2_02_FULL_47_25]OGZ56903.1 MAG: phosphoglycerate kinase [Candidatus Ryanbacteria bacterium RIFCSPLOWO2_12_FULL_47_9c]
MRIHRFINPWGSLKDKTVLLRVDFNEPVEKRKIADSFRIQSTLPVVRDLKKRGARVVIVSHLEHRDRPISFGPFVRQFERILGMKIIFVKEYSQSAIRRGAQRGIVFLENLRFHRGEETNNKVFARTLASFADLYINEAFSVSHRPHASIVGVPHYLPSYAGPLFQKEVGRLSEVFTPRHPFLLIVGGAKFATKFELLKRFLRKADAIFVGGVLANTFLCAHDIPIGISLYEPDAVDDIRKHFSKSQKILLPFDVVLAKNAKAKNAFEVRGSERIRDIGPKTVLLITALARLSKHVVWNGPLGFTENGYETGTRMLLKNLARLKNTRVILGGGDTVEVLDHLHLRHRFYHVSTGGGAMLSFLGDGTLVGIEALIKSQKRLR